MIEISILLFAFTDKVYDGTRYSVVFAIPSSFSSLVAAKPPVASYPTQNSTIDQDTRLWYFRKRCYCGGCHDDERVFLFLTPLLGIRGESQRDTLAGSWNNIVFYVGTPETQGFSEIGTILVWWYICCNRCVYDAYRDYVHMCNYNMGHYDVVVMTGLVRLLRKCNDRLEWLPRKCNDRYNGTSVVCTLVWEWPIVTGQVCVLVQWLMWILNCYGCELY